MAGGWYYARGERQVGPMDVQQLARELKNAEGGATLPFITTSPGAGGGGREEGSVLGGLGRLLDGDNS